MADLLLNIPQTGEQTVVVIDDTIDVLNMPFDTAEALFEKVDDNLEISFDEEGTKIVLENFYTVYDGENIPDFMLADGLVAGEEFFAALDESLMPAAGPAAPTPPANDGLRFGAGGGEELTGGVGALGGTSGGSSFDRNGFQGEFGNDGVNITPTFTATSFDPSALTAYENGVGRDGATILDANPNQAYNSTGIQGVLTADDPDSSDLSFGIVGGTTVGNVTTLTNQYGTLTITNTPPATATYSFVPANGSDIVQGLGQGQSVEIPFTITVTDGNTTSQTAFNVTLTGTNDQPILSVNTNKIDFEEDLAVTSGDLVTSGTSTVADPDNIDTQTFFVGPDGQDVGLTLDATDSLTPANNVLTIQLKTPNGQLVDAKVTVNANGGYTVTVDNDDAQKLAENETATGSFTIYVRDTAGAWTSQDVTVNVVGDNDVPTLNFGNSNNSDAAHTTYDDKTDTNDKNEDGDGDGRTVEGSFTASNVVDGGGGTVTITHANGSSITFDANTGKAVGDNFITTQYGKITVAYNTTTKEFEYTYEQNGAIKHTNNADLEDIFTVKVEDKDGNTDASDTDSGTITITIKDDAPIAKADTNSVEEGATITVDVNNGLLSNDTTSADGGDTVTNVTAEDWTTVKNPDGSFTLTSDAVPSLGTLTVKADGSYTFTSNSNTVNLSTPDFVFKYETTDSDGSTSESTLTISPQDYFTPAALDLGTYDSAVEGANGNVAGHWQKPTSTQSFTLNSPDGLKSITVSEGGEDFTVELTKQPDGSYTVKILDSTNTSISGIEGNNGNLTFAVTESPAGIFKVTYTYTQTKPIQHNPVEGGDRDNSYWGAEEFIVKSATDNNGTETAIPSDKGQNKIEVYIIDDEPVVSSVSDNINSDNDANTSQATISTGVATATIKFNHGADADNSTIVLENGSTYIQGVKWNGTTWVSILDKDPTVNVEGNATKGFIIKLGDVTYTQLLDSNGKPTDTWEISYDVTGSRTEVTTTFTDGDGDKVSHTVKAGTNDIPEITNVEDNTIGYKTTITGELTIEAEDGLKGFNIYFGGKKDPVYVEPDTETKIDGLGTIKIGKDGNYTLELDDAKTSVKVSAVDTDGDESNSEELNNNGKESIADVSSSNPGSGNVVEVLKAYTAKTPNEDTTGTTKNDTFSVIVEGSDEDNLGTPKANTAYGFYVENKWQHVNLQTAEGNDLLNVDIDSHAAAHGMYALSGGTNTANMGEGTDKVVMNLSSTGKGGDQQASGMHASGINSKNTISTETGDDVVEIHTNAPYRSFAMNVDSNGHNLIDTGANNDSVLLKSHGEGLANAMNATSSTAGYSSENKIHTQAGDDSVTIMADNIAMHSESNSGGTTLNEINTGSGKDNVSLEAKNNVMNASGGIAGAHAKNSIMTDEGEDSVKLTSTNGNGMYSSAHIAGAGATNTISTGDDDDKVTIDATNGNAMHAQAKAINSKATNTIDTGAADDTVILNGSMYAKATDSAAWTENHAKNLISTGEGHDSVSVTGGMFADANYADSFNNQASNIIETGEGNDTISVSATKADGGWAVADNGSEGKNIINTGDGDDIISLNGKLDQAIINGGNGIDTLILDDTVNGDGSQTLTFTGDVNGSINLNSSDYTASIIGIEKFEFGEGNDKIDFSGVSGGVTIDGGSGNDTIYGGLGDDILLGGSGSDTLSGGAGADTFVFNLDSFAPDGTDNIIDFSGKNGDEDKIDLSAFAGDEYNVAIRGTDVLITKGDDWDGDDVYTIHTNSNLTEEDILGSSVDTIII